jgi:subtilase family serine protease
MVMRITNVGDNSLSGLVPVSVRITAGDKPTASDKEITRFFTPLNLKAGQGKNVKVKISQLPEVSNGNYHLSLVVDPDSALGEKSEANNSAATVGTIAVAAPFVDLSGAYRTSPSQLAIGKPGKVALQMSNSGNVLADGTINVRVVASTDNKMDAKDVEVATIPVRVKIKPGATKNKLIKLTLPLSLPSGIYYLIAKVDSDNVLNEPDVSNNTVLTEPLSL